jgi:arginase
MPLPVIVFRGTVADHNERATAAASLLGDVIARRLGSIPISIGQPQPISSTGWARALDSAEPELRELADTLDGVWSAGERPILALARNTASIATLPVFARHHPGAVMVWIGADTSLHTPVTTRTGYLGGMVLAAATGLWNSPFGAGLPLSHIAFCGTRDIEPVEQLLIEAGVVAHVHRPGDPLADLNDAIAGRPVFIHFACDALEPGLVPTDYTVAGGYSLTQLEELVQALAVHDILGVEITELEVPKSGPAEQDLTLITDLLWPLIVRCAEAVSLD